MKNLAIFILPLAAIVSSCSMETFFAVGIRLPSGFSNFANKKFAAIEEPYDVVIVPGVPYDPASGSSILKMRIQWAKYLYDNGIARNIIFSGSAVYSPYIEGVAMKIIADSLGIPSDHTFYEIAAEHSTENVYYSWKMARKMGFNRIALATDPFQSFALRGFIKTYCPEVSIIPLIYKMVKSSDSLPAIDLSEVSVDSFVSIVDRETFAQRREGTRGEKIAKEVRLAQPQRFQANFGPSFTRK